MDRSEPSASGSILALVLLEVSESTSSCSVAPGLRPLKLAVMAILEIVPAKERDFSVMCLSDSSFLRFNSSRSGEDASTQPLEDCANAITWLTSDPSADGGKSSARGDLSMF